MSGAINVTGVPTGWAVPNDYLEINFGVGPAAVGAGQYTALLWGNKTAAGSATLDTVVYGPSSAPSLQSEQDCINLFGAGSELHRLWRRFRAVNKTTPLYAIAATESGGNAATTTVTVATTATANATLRIWVGSESCDTPIATNNSPTTIGDNAVIQVNNHTEWPVTVANTAGALLFTTKNKGPRANEVRVRAAIVQADGTVATTVSPNNTATAATGGTTEDSWTTALSTVLPARYYYHVCPSTNLSGTNFDDLVTQVIAQALPVTGIRQRVITASVDTQGNASTVAANSAINTPRCQIAWLQTADWTAGEIAAQKAAVLSQFEDLAWAYNFRDFGKGTVGDVDTSIYWKLPAPFTQANWPTSTSINTALNNGLEPIAVDGATGGTHETWSTTTKHKNGANFDYRARSSHIVSVCDRWGDELLLNYAVMFGAKNVADDPKTGEPLPDRSVVTPRQVKSMLFALIDKYAGRYLKHAATIKAGVEVLRDPDNQSRLGARIPLQVIDLLLQNVINIADNSSSLV